ncbi:hypothetical protein MMC24_006288 [Lignoscripta atroalba]|nr:hypothetical protein [Lignoscripta atroalba]
MRHARHLTTDAEALQRVFFPGGAPSNVFLFRRRNNPLQPHLRSSARTTVTFLGGVAVPPPRTYGPSSQTFHPTSGRQQQKQQETRPRDEGIRSPTVHLVDDTTNSLAPPAPLPTILSSFDRTTHFLVQVATDASTSLPVCKIVNKLDFRTAERNRAKAAKAVQSVAKSHKTIELGWAIAPNDLDHRLKKMVEFLEEGRRVDIVIARKRKSRLTTVDEGTEVVKGIRQRVGGVEGAREWKEMEGEVGGVMKIYLEGTSKKK